MILFYFESYLVYFHLIFRISADTWPICCDFVEKKSAATFLQ